MSNETAPPPAPRRVDGRSRMARRFRALVKQFTDDLGDKPTKAQAELVRQAALLVVRAGEIQQAVLAGDAVDDDVLVRLTNSAVRALSALGIQQKRNVKAPDLRAYLAKKERGQ
jgi:hypothetical protein